MPGAVLDELEISLGRGPGGGRPVRDGGDSGGPDPAAARRASMTGITLAVGGILMFFMALVSAYIVRKGLNNDWVVFPLPRVLWANTAVLLASSVTIELARRQLRRGQIAAFKNLWGLTTGLGLLFVGGQYLAWRAMRAEGVFMATNPSSSFFYLLTAAHAIHLLGGIIALSYVALRHLEKSRLTQADGAQVASIYWHFMDGLWVFLLLLLTLGR